jgi:hypothetical protein
MKARNFYRIFFVFSCFRDESFLMGSGLFCKESRFNVGNAGSGVKREKNSSPMLDTIFLKRFDILLRP